MEQSAQGSAMCKANPRCRASGNPKQSAGTTRDIQACQLDEDKAQDKRSWGSQSEVGTAGVPRDSSGVAKRAGVVGGGRGREFGVDDDDDEGVVGG
jgi:hypothetical protein